MMNNGFTGGIVTASIRPIVHPLITFEGIAALAAVGNYYNGGGGQNYGVTFSANAAAVTGYSTIANAPPPGSTVVYWGTGSSITMTFSAAVNLTAGVSFYYSSASLPLTVTLYNGATAVASSGALAAVGTAGCSIYICNWGQCMINYVGPITSVVFAGDPGTTVVDNISWY